MLKKSNLLVLLLLILSCSAFGRTLTFKTAAEFLYYRNNLRLRVKPLNYAYPSDSWGLDILLGWHQGLMNAYAYYKTDFDGRSWIGMRLDWTLKGLQKKLNIKLQFRAFKGLNLSSSDHLYLIPYVNYAVGSSKRMRVGFMGIGKFPRKSLSSFYLGPAMTLTLSPHLKFRFSVGEDLWGSGGLLYLKSYISL